MRLFSRNARRKQAPSEHHLPPQAEPVTVRAPEAPAEIRASRTLVKSEPELAEFLATEQRLSSDAIEVTLSEKGFGTRVMISAAAGSGLGQDDLEQLLDELAEPKKRPFSSA